MAKSMAKKTKETEEVVKPVSTKEETTITKKETKVVEKPKDFAPEDQIRCVSMTHGELIMVGRKSDLEYTWANYGDVTYVEYQDLFAAKTRKSDFIYSPLFIIEDEELLNHPRWADVKEFYENMYSYDDIKEILSMDNASFRTLLDKAPKGLRKAIEVEIVTQLEDGTFDSLQKVKIVDEICGTDLKCYIS